MNMKENLPLIEALDADKRARWLIDLAWAMTVSARAGYPLARQAARIPHLMAFNEMQHQVFNYLRHSGTQHNWTIESFVEGLCQKAKVSGIEGDFGWALNWSLERLGTSQ